MQIRILSLLLLLALCFTSWQGDATAANPTPVKTTITVTDMHCKHCAQKIASKLYLVPGVLEVRASLKANQARISPQANLAPSPKALWEAIEAAGFVPVSLSGPAGEFTSKPDA